MKKIKIGIMAISMFSLVFISQDSIHAENFAGNEEYWKNKCSVTQSSAPETRKCKEFTEYYKNQVNELDGQLSSLSSEVKNIENNIEETSSTLKSLQEMLDTITKSIELNEANIRTINTQIEKLDIDIAKKQVEIDKRDKIIQDRMLAEQSTLGTNVEIEIIMGANNLVDMIRKADGLQRITASDQEEIDKITEEKNALKQSKNEQTRLKNDVEIKREENVKNKKNTEEIKSQQQELLDTYQKKEAELNEKMRSVQVDISTIQNNIISLSSSNGLDLSGNSGLALPVQGGSLSAGTWYYPGGGTHLGMDIAASIGTPITAPAAGIVLYANNPAPTNGGHLGNWIGFPAGGGNTLHFLTQSNGTTYAISFFHMSQGGFAVNAGDSVAAGQLLGLTGNSGNSTGPHCHIEVINLGGMSLDAAISRFKSTADFAWGNGWGDYATGNVCGIKSAPCREKPENIF